MPCWQTETPDLTRRGDHHGEDLRLANENKIEELRVPVGKGNGFANSARRWLSPTVSASIRRLKQGTELLTIPSWLKL
jgi:hypothetical protein